MLRLDNYAGMCYNGSMDIADNFSVIRYIGDPTPDFICHRLNKELPPNMGSYRAHGSLYGTHKPCETCEFRFACITGGLGEALSEGEEYVTVNEFGQRERHIRIG